MKMLINYVAGWSIEIDANPFTKVTEAVEETDTNGLVEEIKLEGKVIFKRNERGGFSPAFEIDKKYDPRPPEDPLAGESYEHAWFHPRHHHWI